MQLLLILRAVARTVISGNSNTTAPITTTITDNTNTGHHVFVKSESNWIVSSAYFRTTLFCVFCFCFFLLDADVSQNFTIISKFFCLCTFEWYFSLNSAIPLSRSKSCRANFWHCFNIRQMPLTCLLCISKSGIMSISCILIKVKYILNWQKKNYIRAIKISRYSTALWDLWFCCLSQ